MFLRDASSSVTVTPLDHPRNLCYSENTQLWTENIPLDFEPNKYYLMKINRNSEIHGSFVH